MRDNYDVINELLLELKHRLSDVNYQIHVNDLYMKEAEMHVKSLEESESEDFKLFSPRSMRDRYKEEIDKTVSSKIVYESKNRELNETKKILLERIENLENLLLQKEYISEDLYSQENDRQRIARDLHDTSLQDLIYIIHKLELCEMYIDENPEKAKVELSAASNGLRGIIKDIRDIVYDLQPTSFYSLSLKDNFESLLENIKEKGSFQIFSEIENVSCENRLTSLFMYRIVQEGLNNIVKHACADKIVFRCNIADDCYVIDIEDNGCGFCEEKIGVNDKHFGLRFMRERADRLNGKIDIFSAEGNGTKIHIKIPVKY